VLQAWISEFLLAVDAEVLRCGFETISGIRVDLIDSVEVELSGAVASMRAVRRTKTTTSTSGA
jgi:hypothetical protein